MLFIKIESIGENIFNTWGYNMNIIWRVIKNCKFAGYVVSDNMVCAQLKAKEKYGENCWVEFFIK